MLRHGLLLALVALTMAALAMPAAAEEPGKIEIKARTEPAEIVPGGSGTLVIEATLGPKLHVYATDKGGQFPMAWKPIDAAGVTYDVKGAKKTKHEEYTEPVFKDKFDIWHNTFEIRIPITVAKDATAGTKIGALVDYQGCTNQMCFAPVKKQEAATRLVLSGGGAGAPAVGNGGGAPAVGNGGGVPAVGNGGGAKPNPPVVGSPDKGPRLPIPITEEDVSVKLELAKDGKAFLVTFTPEFGRKIYGRGAEDGIPIAVKPKAAEGVVWGEVDVPVNAGTHDPLTVTVPFERTTATSVELDAHWQVCLDSGICKAPDHAPLVVTFDAGAGDQPKTPPDEPKKPDDVPKGEIVLPVVVDDDLKVKDENLIQSVYADYGLLVLGLIFLLGAGLAFTPCVLPIIPITVAVVTGGRSDLPRKRLLALLSTYVMSMALTFGAFGVVAAAAGTTMSAAFQMPEVIWGIGGLFLVLAFGMLGVIEIQPPQWMTKLQGGAQQRGGSLVGAALLGCVMAFVASPCTGPFIVAMSVVLAKTQSIPLGFSMFFAMGLGMGAVLFAFGALNFALRPGPWMVWVRYGFGMLLFGGALYYVADAGLLQPPLLYVVAIVMSALAGYLVARHLVKAEGEQPQEARTRGLKVAGMFVVAAALIAWITLPPSLPENVDPELVAFQKLESVDQLKDLVAENVAAKRATVVDVWGTWCHNCKVYEQFMITDDRLRHEFSKLARLKIDVSTDNRPDLRDALGIPREPAPYFVFIDAEGRIRRAADLAGWDGEEKAKAALLERLQLVLGDEFGPTAKGRAWRYGKKTEARRAK